MGFNNNGPWVGFMLASQMLIQNRLLFDIIFDEHLNDLSNYKVLFLADQECLSDHQMEHIQSFVEQGGGLVATGHTSLYTEWRRRRPDFGLKQYFGVSAPRWNGPEAFEAEVPGGVVKRSFGKGKVVYIPAILPATHKPPGEPMSSRYWTAATNQATLRDAVRWAMNDQPTLQTPENLSPYITMELIHQLPENRLILHVLNYNHARNSPTSEIPVELTIPVNQKVKRVQMLTPDLPSEKRALDWSGEKVIRFAMPSVEIYSIAALDLT
jgi:hypothetical protein